MQELKDALAHLKIQITKYDTSKVRPIYLRGQSAMGVAKFISYLISALGPDMAKFPGLIRLQFNSGEAATAVENVFQEIGVARPETEEEKNLRRMEEIPEHFKTLTLNVDPSHVGRDTKFYVTTQDEHLSYVSGPVYLKILGLQEDQAIGSARIAVPEYRPRSRRGIIISKSDADEKMPIFNSYIPPDWKDVEPLPTKSLPKLFEKVVKHILPLAIEREYFYHWLYCSLFERSFVYLILCGAPGVGKNRLKLIMRALHGHTNTVDGKRSTLVDRFNSQLSDATLAWFDELHYNSDMENVMKELQNDSISIEKKNVDATKSTRLYASLVISNNKPRDNYIAFDARKFAPLVLNPKRLETSMTKDEIDLLTTKVQDPRKKGYDPIFLASIVAWLKKNGKSKKFSNCEYKGPMFYRLAHTSMTKWQKKAITVVIETDPVRGGPRIILDKKKGFLWSSIEESISRKGDKSSVMPDYSSVKHFFDVFLDGAGDKPFITENVPNSIVNDFHVRVSKKGVKILSEQDVLSEMEVDDGEEETEEIDYSFI